VIAEYRLAEAFDLMDSDDSGFISRENLREILGEHSDERYIDQLIAEADFKKDGRISYSEFLQALSRLKREDKFNGLLIEESEGNGKNSIHSSRHSRSSSADADEVLRKFGLIKGLRKAMNSSTSSMSKDSETRR
jgi:hypothetical protein